MTVGKDSLQQRLDLIKKHKLDKSVNAKNLRRLYKKAKKAETSLKKVDEQLTAEESHRTITDTRSLTAMAPKADTNTGLPGVHKYEEGVYGDVPTIKDNIPTPGQPISPEEPIETAPAPPSYKANLPKNLRHFKSPTDKTSPEQPDAQSATLSPVAQPVVDTPASSTTTPAQAVPPTTPETAEQQSINEIVAQSPVNFRNTRAFMEGTAAGGRKALDGLIQMGAAGLEKIGVISKNSYNKLTDKMSKRQKAQFNEILLNNPGADKQVVKNAVIAGEVVPSLMGGGAVGAGKTIAGAAAKLGTLGAGVGAAQFVEPDQEGMVGSRLFNTVLGGTLGALSGAVAGTLSKMAQGFTKKGAKVSLAEGLKQARTDKMGGQEALEAARRQGTTLPLAEATQHPNLLQKAGSIKSLDPKTKTKLVSKVLKSESQLAKRSFGMIDDVLKGETRGGAQQRASQLLSRVNKKSVPVKVRTQLLKNPTIKANFENVLADKNLQGTMGRRSFEMFDTVKRQMRAEAKGLVQAGKSGAVSKRLQTSVQEIDDALKSSSKNYKTGMELSQRYKIYDKWKDKLSNVTQTAGKDKPSLKQIYNRMFDDDKVFKELVTDMKAVGISTQPAKDLRLILNLLTNSPLGKLMGKQTDLVTGMAIDQGVSGVATRSMFALFKRRYNKELVRLMTSGKWDTELSNISKIKSDSQMIDRLAKLLTISGTKTPGMGTRNRNKRK